MVCYTIVSPIHSLADPKYKETYHPMKYTKLDDVTNEVNKPKQVIIVETSFGEVAHNQIFKQLFCLFCLGSDKSYYICPINSF